jgi:transcriptional regulator with XRE-family HTH domain
MPFEAVKPGAFKPQVGLLGTCTCASFRDDLRRIRHERKLSHKQLADDAEIDPPCMSRVDRVVISVGLEIIGKLATILGVGPAEFCRPALPVQIPEDGRLSPFPPPSVS